MKKATANGRDSPVFEIGYFRLRGFLRMQLLFGLPTAWLRLGGMNYAPSPACLGISLSCARPRRAPAWSLYGSSKAAI